MQRGRRLKRDVPLPAAGPTVLRSFIGPQADEYAILCRPEDRSADAARQAESAYRALASQLADHRASFDDLTREALVLADVRELPQVLAVRNRVLAGIGQDSRAPLPTFIQQPSVDPGTRLELSVWASVPHDPAARSVRDVRAQTACTCEGCVRSGARLVRLGDEESLHTSSVYGTGGDALQQVGDMFRNAERLLQQCGMGFGDVVRTWIYLRDIDRDYAALNQARREFFRDRGVGLRPASTGVQGVPFPAGHDIAISLEARQSPLGVGVARMSTPFLNEAWSYGADFSRGLRLTDANKVTLQVSGTASIDEAGRTVHAGDFAAQADRMLDNIESLLAGQRAGFGDIVSAVTYLKRASDAPVLRSTYARRGFDRFPCAIVHAPLCRPELLCETEVVAWLPLVAAGA